MITKKLLLITTIITTNFVLGAPKDYTELKTENDFNKAISGNKPAIVKFHAPWCGWCKKMEPLFNNSAKKYSNKVNSYAVNVDEKSLKALAKKHKIAGLPTTVFYKNGKEVKRERGGITNQEELDGIYDVFVNGPKKLIIRSKPIPAPIKKNK